MRDENNSGPKPLGGQGFLEKSPAHKPLRDGTASADQSSDNKQQDAQPAAGGAGQNRVANPAAKVRMALEAPGQVQEQPEYLTVAGRGRAVRKTTYMLVGLFIVGLVCLWFMVRKSTPRQAGAAGREDTQIEQAISRLTGVSSEMFDRMDEIVGKFYEFSEVQQVKVNELAKNPFRHDMFVGDLQALRMRESSDERARQTAADMQLLSIIESELGNCCMIDDRVLYEGDSIRGFRVREIRKTSVKLQSEESEIELKLSE